MINKDVHKYLARKKGMIIPSGAGTTLLETRLANAYERFQSNYL